MIMEKEVKRFEDLQVWKDAMNMAVSVVQS